LFFPQSYHLQPQQQQQHQQHQQQQQVCNPHTTNIAVGLYLQLQSFFVFFILFLFVFLLAKPQLFTLFLPHNTVH
jgi:hypothetical protein